MVLCPLEALGESACPVVNLPEYRLRAMNPDGTVSFYKKVIIGKAYGHKSPIFEKEIQYVIFRP